MFSDLWEERIREEKEKTRKDTATEIFCDLETKLQVQIELYLAQGNTQAINMCKTLYNYICMKARDYNVEVFNK